MTREEFKSLVDGIKEKLDETSGALLAEDLIAILSAFNVKMEELEKLTEENTKLKTDNEEKIIDEDEEEIPEEEKITIEDVIDEKGEIV